MPARREYLTMILIKKKYTNYSEQKIGSEDVINYEIEKLLSLGEDFFLLAQEAQNQFLLGETEKNFELYGRYGKLASDLILGETSEITDLEAFKKRIQKRIQKIVKEFRLRISEMEIRRDEISTMSKNRPVYLGNGDWVYKDTVYEIKGEYSIEYGELLLLEFINKEHRKMERLKNKYENQKDENLKYKRDRISEEVRIAVWRRDQGKCARCGNRENLEYDHIVPVSKGGSNTARNIELLCQDCNRAKGNRIE
jgi:hypothetical protein